MTRNFRVLALSVLVALAACEAPVTGPSADLPADLPAEANLDNQTDLELTVASAGDLQGFVDAANASLAARGLSVAVSKAEWIDGVGDADAQKIVFANDRTLRLGSRWVSGDARRGATGSDLTQASFSPLMLADGAIATEPLVDASFDTWNGLRCSNLQVNKVVLPPGVLPSIFFVGGDPFAADISTLGWLPGSIFDLVLGPGASGSVLGVTFTFVWLDGPGGDPTDVDGDGRNDTALKEVWYNDAFSWSVGGLGGIDVESVALHENGHALELGHFGKLTAHFKKGVFDRIQASPRAVMNASYIGPITSPRGTDSAAMCGNYADWK